MSHLYLLKVAVPCNVSQRSKADIIRRLHAVLIDYEISSSLQETKSYNLPKNQNVVQAPLSNYEIVDPFSEIQNVVFMNSNTSLFYHYGGSTSCDSELEDYKGRVKGNGSALRVCIIPKTNRG